MKTEKSSNEKQGNAVYVYNMLAAVYAFIMKNLEFIPLVIALQLFWDVGWDWKYWVTITVVAFCSGVSTRYWMKNCR